MDWRWSWLVFVCGCSGGFTLTEPGIWWDTASDRCSYTVERVAEGQPIEITWSELPDRDSIDRILIGQLPLGLGGLQNGQCAPFEQTELLLPEEGVYTLMLTPEQVGLQGNSAMVTLRSGDLEADSLTLVPDTSETNTRVSFLYQ